MLIFTKIDEIQSFLTSTKVKRNTTGFVPTMGALHAGHISLINAAKKHCDITICSVFVNPTQFNDKTDLERYPRTPEHDIEKLRLSGCDALFMPPVEEMYPAGDERKFDFGYLENILEGAHRPGHFNGVAQIVSLLFEIVKPDKAFLGEKDYQQVMIIKELVKQKRYPIQIVACPTLREPDGLAMSSRNALLSPEERKAASLLPQLLQKAGEWKKQNKSVKEIKDCVMKRLAENNLYRLDYFAICDSNSLKEINQFSESQESRALIACYVGKIRLIDNLVLP